MIPNQHEKNEWSRMAQAAYGRGLNDIGHRYSGAASLRTHQVMTDPYFDSLQEGYRAWLINNVYPTT